MRGTIRSAADRARLIAAYRASGLSTKAFAEREGVASSTLYQWLANGAVPAVKARAEPTPPFRIARVLRSAVPASKVAVVPESALVVELGAARVHVRQGFDRATLGAVLDMLVDRNPSAAR